MRINFSKILLITAIFLVSSPSFATPKPKTLQTELTDMIKASGKHRSAGTQGAANALKWLKERATKIGGWEVEEHVFEPDHAFAIENYKEDFKKLVADKVRPDHPEYIKWDKFTNNVVAYQKSLIGKKGVNLILRKRGTNPQLTPLLLGAHYDTITHNHDTLEITPEAPAPGADDNGAAVVVLLSLAEKFKDLKPEQTVEIVFFDFEEAFFLGSRAYAQALQKKKIKVELINLEMISWNKPTPNRVKLYARSLDQLDAGDDHKLARMAQDTLTKTGLLPEILGNNFNRSDNWPFWAFGHAAISISQDWERNFNSVHYHTSLDTPDRVDWKFVEKIQIGVENLVKSALKN